MKPVNTRVLVISVWLVSALYGLSLAAGEKPALAAGGKAVQEDTDQAKEKKKKKQHKAGYTDKPNFGGPNTPEAQIQEDDEVKQPTFRFPGVDRSLEPWYAWKKRLDERHGLQLGGQYVSLYQGLGDWEAEEDEASSGLARVNGKWTVLGRGTKNSGRINFTVDHRHRYRDIPPADLAGEIGYIGQTGLAMNSADLVLINLSWAQSFNEGDTGLIVGRFDPNDYMNVLGYANPWTSFQNLAVVFDVSLALPDTSYGMGAGHWLNEQWYVLGTVNDANGVATELELFAGGAEFFSQVEVGWSPSKEARYFTNVNLTVWHVDAREEAGIEAAEGVLFSANRTFGERWMPFFRLGFSDGSAPIYNTSVTAGLIQYFPHRSDLFGLSVNWGDPPADALSEQVTAEFFYRWQMAQNLAITPSLQWLGEPALNEVDDRGWVFGLRSRFTF
ncbi:MAG: carbohydrate porin [Acidobacteriota bacterium]|nr:carbohydrate porin [Acidobacteriota bacterium]